MVAERKPLAESIRELRRELGLTQVALAEKTGAAATSIQHYETGSRSPDCHTLARTAIAAYKACKLEAAEAIARHLPGFDEIFVPRWWLKGGGSRQVEVLIKDEEN